MQRGRDSYRVACNICCITKGGSVIPVVTFLHDLVSSVKGPYHRLVGRYTQRYLSRAAGKSKNEMQKKTLFIAAAGVDDVFSEVLGVQRGAKGFSKSAAEKKVTRKAVNTAFRVYLSTLLILLGNDKDRLLNRIGLDEAAWVQLWCAVFEYDAGDMACFNQVLLTAYQQGGIEELLKAACASIAEALSPFNGEAAPPVEAAVRAGLTKDVAAILK